MTNTRLDKTISANFQEIESLENAILAARSELKRVRYRPWKRRYRARLRNRVDLALKDRRDLLEANKLLVLTTTLMFRSVE